jgi:L-lactate utilization protein LutB
MRGNAAGIPNLEGRKARLKQTREYSIGNKELLNQAIQSWQNNGIRVKLAQTKGEAMSLIPRGDRGRKTDC